LTLAPVGSPALTVAWTLQHEVFFYGLAWLLLQTRQILAGSLIWASLIVMANLFDSSPIIPLRLINLEFSLGIFCAWYFVSGRLRNSSVLIGIGILAIAVFFINGNRDQSVIFGLGIASLLLPVVRAESTGKIQITEPFILLGAASYAIYLVHNPLISLSIRGLAFIGAGWLASIIALLAISVAAGIAYHLWFEVPAIGFNKRWLRYYRSHWIGAVH
jgi:exopolysaccharide production protein ExoZ